MEIDVGQKIFFVFRGNLNSRVRVTTVTIVYLIKIDTKF